MGNYIKQCAVRPHIGRIQKWTPIFHEKAPLRVKLVRDNESGRRVLCYYPQYFTCRRKELMRRCASAYGFVLSSVDEHVLSFYIHFLDLMAISHDILDLTSTVWKWLPCDTTTATWRTIHKKPTPTPIQRESVSVEYRTALLEYRTALLESWVPL